MPLGGAIVAGVGLAYGAYNSAHQAAQAKKIQDGLKDPNYVIPQELYQNREIARQMAQIGLPASVTNNATNQINQTQATSLAAAQNSSNPAAAIAGITGQTNQAKANLSAEDATAKNTNERFFLNENNQLGQQELEQQQSNVFDKFTRDFNQMQAYRGASMDNLNNVIGGAQQLGGAYLNYASNNPTNPSANITKLNADITAHPYQIKAPKIDPYISGVSNYQLQN